MHSASQLFAAGMAHQRVGEIGAAEAAYRELLMIDPQHADALHLLAVLLHQTNRSSEALEALARAIALRPTSPDFHNSCGNILREVGRVVEAIVECRKALELEPGFFQATVNLGIALQAAGELREAIDVLKAAAARNPNSSIAHANLASALNDAKEFTQAVDSAQSAVRLDPNHAGAFIALGYALWNLRRLEEAAVTYARAGQLRPDLAELHMNHGTILREMGSLREAIAAQQRAAQLAPQSFEVLSNFGATLWTAGRLREAREMLSRAIEIKPDFAQSHNNLGNVLKDAGQIEAAMNEYRAAMKLDPANSEAHSNLLYAMHFDPRVSADDLLQAHLKWNALYAAHLPAFVDTHASAGSSRSSNENSANSHSRLRKKLRIGYVSADFRWHPVGRFMLPLLANHNHQNFEIFCYSDVTAPDKLTQKLELLANIWRRTSALSHEALANQIHDDEIDILIDLGLHLSHNRLLAFARKPAPVQVTYLGYASTTGLGAMDYRLTDEYLDPPGAAQAYSERSVYLKSYWCYPPPTQSMAVAPLPMSSAAHVTFGCLNNLSKVSDDSLRLWAVLLREMQRSRLILHCQPGEHAARIIELFAREGVSGDRIELIGGQNFADYLATYARIDIALDPIPYNGGTTTCDALWMGVPVVTMTGATAVSRAGSSILSNVGLPDLIARTREGYLQLAKNLANDVSRLSEFRSSLNERMRASRLCDANAFVADLENAYREMWKNACVAPSS